MSADFVSNEPVAWAGTNGMTENCGELSKASPALVPTGLSPGDALPLRSYVLKTRMVRGRNQRRNAKKNPYYHVTSVEAVASILRDGLKGTTESLTCGETLKRPSMFVLLTDSTPVLDSFAINQVWPWRDVKEYAVIRIAPAGVTGKVLRDDEAETTAAFQRVIQQDVILPEHLKHVSTRHLNWSESMKNRILDKLFSREKLTREECVFASQFFPQIIEDNLLGDFE